MNMRKGLALLLCATLLFSCLPTGIADRAVAASDAPVVVENNVETSPDPAPAPAPATVSAPASDPEPASEPAPAPADPQPAMPSNDGTNEPADEQKEEAPQDTGSETSAAPTESADPTETPEPENTPKAECEHNWVEGKPTTTYSVIKGNKKAHNVTVTVKATCSICKEEKTVKQETTQTAHSWKRDGETHECKLCGYKGEHDWIVETQEDGTEKTVCSVCSLSQGSADPDDELTEEPGEEPDKGFMLPILPVPGLTAPKKTTEPAEEPEEPEETTEPDVETIGPGEENQGPVEENKEPEDEQDAEPCEHVWEKKDDKVHVCTECEEEEKHQWKVQEVSDGKTRSVCEVCGAEKRTLFEVLTDFIDGGKSKKSEDEDEDDTVTLEGEDGVEREYTITDYVAGETDANADAGIMLMDLNIENETKACTSPSGHLWQVTGESYGEWEVQEANDKKNAPVHYRQREVTANLRCTKCGATAKGKGKDTEAEPHVFNSKGVCACKATTTTAKHEHTIVYRREIERVGDVSKRTPYTHTCRVRFHFYKECALCGWIEAEDVSKSKVTTAQHEMDDNGTCKICGYHVKCDHPKRVTKTETGDYTKIVPKKDEGKHTLEGQTVYEVVRCVDCNAILSKTVKEEKGGNRDEPCTFVSGYCIVCGQENKCDHKGQAQISRTETTMTYDIKSNGTKTHSYRTDETTYTYCGWCKQLLSTRVVTDIKHKGEHTFVDGVCNTCGARKGQGVSKATPTPEPLRTDEMVVTLLLDIQRQLMTAGTTVEIMGVDQVLTDEELARYETLTMPERVLVAFTALGMQPDTVYGMEGMSAYPSIAAQTLIADVAARRSRMTVEERTAVETAIATYFTKSVDAMGAQTIMFTLRVANAAGTIDHRYTFRYDPVTKLWLYVKMELVNQESIGVK